MMLFAAVTRTFPVILLAMSTYLLFSSEKEQELTFERAYKKMEETVAYRVGASV